MQINKAKFKNYGLWVAMFALLGMVLTDIFGASFVPSRYQAYVDILTTILLYLGIINNPTTENKWFKDDPQ